MSVRDSETARSRERRSRQAEERPQRPSVAGERRWHRRLLAGAVLAGGLLVATAVPALAHVTVHSDDASKGGFAEISFRVPTERDDASTVKVDVQLPTDHPIASVSTKPIPGWTAAVTTTPLAQPITTDDGQVTQAVSEIVWTADPGGGIKPGEFEDFVISAGPLPDDVDSLRFPTIQTYSDGQQVAWIENAPPGGPEPDHPTPVLALTAATGDAASSSAPSSAPQVAATPDSSQKSTTNNNGRRLAFLALLVAIAGVVIGIVALVRGGREPRRS